MADRPSLSGSRPLVIRVTSANDTVAAGEELWVDPNGATRTVALPSSPQPGQRCAVGHAGATATYPVNVSGTVNGDPDGARLVTPGACATFVYVSASLGWRVEGTGLTGAGADLRTAMFGGPGRTAPPSVELRCTTPFSTTAGQDARAEGGWTVIGNDPDAMVTVTDAAGGFSRIRAPLPGRYRGQFWARSGATSGSAAIKLLLNSMDILTGPIASDLKPAGGEGTPLYASFDRVLAVDDLIRWSVWSSVASTWAPNSGNFAGVLTYLVMRWIGPS